jgi:hypothetical protein
MAAAEKKKGFDTLAVALSAMAALILVWVVSLFLRGGFLAAQAREYDAKVLAPVNETVRTYRAEQQALLDGGYRWIDQQEGTVGIPVDRAVDLVVERHGSGPDSGNGEKP